MRRLIACWRPSGYGPRIVKENVELLRFVNEQIGGLDKELRKIAREDPQARRLMTLIGVGPATAVAVSCWVGERGSSAQRAR